MIASASASARLRAERAVTQRARIRVRARIGGPSWLELLVVLVRRRGRASLSAAARPRR